MQRSGGDHEVGTIMAKLGAQHTPSPRRRQIEGHDTLAVKDEQLIQPRRKRLGEGGIRRALSLNAALDFANADDAEEKFSGALTSFAEPSSSFWLEFIARIGGLLPPVNTVLARRVRSGAGQ